MHQLERNRLTYSDMIEKNLTYARDCEEQMKDLLSQWNGAVGAARKLIESKIDSLKVRRDGYAAAASKARLASAKNDELFKLAMAVKSNKDIKDLGDLAGVASFGNLEELAMYLRNSVQSANDELSELRDVTTVADGVTPLTDIAQDYSAADLIQQDQSNSEYYLQMQRELGMIQ